VGAVCGRLALFNPTRPGYEEATYWSYETLLKLYEGSHGAVLGANGGLYAVRRALFERLPPRHGGRRFRDPVRLLERGYRVVFEASAVAFEETTEDLRREFSRRARISAGNFQALGRHLGMLAPWRSPFVAYAFWSHKVLRWLAPLLLVTALITNAVLAERSRAYAALLVGQVAFYGLSLAGGRGLAGPLRRAAGWRGTSSP